MNYGQNTQDAGLVSQVIDWLDSPKLNNAHEKWLLVDGAIVGEKVSRRIVTTFGVPRVCNIFSEIELAVYGWRAPHLIRLDAGPLCRREVSALLKSSVDVPAFGMIEGTGDQRQIQDIFLWLAQIQTVDMLKLYCRFADTRITPVLIDVLNIKQREALYSAIKNWQIVNRKGTLDCIFSRTDASGQSVERHHLNPILLSDEQYLKMMAASEADEIFQMLCEGAPELVPVDDKGDFQLHLAKLIDAGRALEVTQTNDLYQFCIIALTTRSDFFRDPVLRDTWQNIKQKGASFTALISAWTDETWDALVGAPVGPIGPKSAKGDQW